MTTTATKNGFFRRTLDALIEARQRDADRYLNNTLLSFDDQMLSALGYSRADLAKRTGR